MEFNAEQKRAIEHNEGPLLIIAGAGTGKTAVITERIVHLIKSEKAKPSEILALTFTEKAAEEMNERVDLKMPYGYDQVEIATFHSFCDKILRSYGLHIGLDTNYKILSQAQAYILFRKNLFDFPLNKLRPLGSPTQFIGDILKHFSRLQDEDTSPDEYIKFVDDINTHSSKDGGYSEVQVEEFKELAGTYKAYTDAKIANSTIDFGDLINLTLKLFRERPHILDELRSNLKYIMVDEFQDSNYTQNVLVNMLALGGDLDKVSRKARKEANITVVGDDDQSIYKFRGAAISNILQFKQNYPEAKKIVLTENYRSRQEILNAAYQLIQNNNPYRLEVTESINKRLNSNVEGSELTQNPLQFVFKERGSDEAEFVAKEILKLTGNKDRLKDDNSIVDKEFASDGQGMFVDVEAGDKGDFRFAEIAILARANSHLDLFVQAFKYYGIPFKFKGPKGLYTRPEIQNLIAYLKVLSDFSDDISMFKLLKMEIFSLQPREIVDLMQQAKHQRSSIFKTLEELWGVKLGANSTLLLEPSIQMLTQNIFEQQNVQNISDLLNLFNKSLIQIKEGATVGEILYTFFTESGYLAALLAENTYESQFKIQNISKYFNLLKEYEENNEGARVSDYIEYLNYSIEIGENPKTEDELLEEFDAVTLMSVHGSKGLEFPVVFLVNLVADRFPTKNRSDALPIPEELIKEVLPEDSDGKSEHLSEERRLFYVGITRAKRILYLTGAQFYGDTKRPKKRSIFLDEIDNRSVNKEKSVPNKSGKPAQFAVQVSSFNDSLDISGLGLNNIEKISYSHVSTYEKCPKQYKYRYILGLPSPENAALSFGKSIHNTLLYVYAAISKGESPTLDEVESVFEERWIKSGYDSRKHEQLKYKQGQGVIRKLYNDSISKDFDRKPIFLEKWFKYKLDDIILTGSIDRIDQIGTNSEGRPIVELVDYKTGKSRDAKEVKSDLQLAIYTIVAEELLGFEVAKASLFFIEHGIKLDAQIDEKLKEKLKEEVISVVKMIRSGDFEPKPGFMCRFCDYRNICEDAMI